jgi:selenium metabolism protein YedF
MKMTAAGLQNAGRVQNCRRFTEMIQVNAMGDACPIPVVKTKNAIRDLKGAGVVETLVDNEIAVRNLTKLAKHNGYDVKSEKLEDNKFKVTMTVGEGAAMPEKQQKETCLVKPDAAQKNTVVVISSDKMGNGNDELGKLLLKGFIYALGQQDILPKTILFYNGGATVTCEESPSLDDLKSLQAQGVEILTCGTCLNFYGLTDKLKVGDVSNMYDITEKLTQADLIVKP